MQQTAQKPRTESVITRWNDLPNKDELFLAALGYDPNHTGNIKCPIHDGDGDNFSVMDNGIRCHSRCGDRSHYRALGEARNLSDTEAVLLMAPHLGNGSSPQTSTTSTVTKTIDAEKLKADKEAQKKSPEYAKQQASKALAMEAWNATKPYANHDEDHFANRECDRPTNPDIRYTDSFHVGKIHHNGPTLYTVRRNAHGENTGGEVHFMDANHNIIKENGKSKRRTLGMRDNDAYTIRQPAGATTCHIAEGSVTAASVAMGVPTCDAVFASGPADEMPGAVPVLSGFKSVWIWADNDQKDQGEKAARKTAEGLIAAGVGEVRIMMAPHVGIDWNDVLADPELGLDDIKAHYEGGGELITPEPELTESERFDLECSQEFGELRTMFNPVVNRKTFDFVEGLLTTGGISVFWSAPNIGKTAMVMDLSTSIANAALEPNREGFWRGDTAVEGGAVVYVSCEGMTGVALRGNALTLSGKLKEGAPLFPYRSDEVFNMIEPESVDRFVKYCKYIAKHSGHELKMIVVDTLAAATAGIDENKEMQKVLTSAQDIQRRLGGDVHFSFTHHSGKQLDAGMRGGSALNGGVDTTILLEKVQVQRYATDTVEERIRATVKKQKDMMLAKPFDSVLRVVDLGLNEKGRQITSCVIDAVPYSDNAVLVGSPSAKKKEAEGKKEREKAENQVKLREAFEKLGGNGRATVQHLASSLKIQPNTLKGKYWMGDVDSMFQTRGNTGMVYEVGYSEADSVSQNGSGWQFAKK